MVKCVFCGSDTRVLDKRDNEDSTRRRRECTGCDRRFTTYERPEITLTVVKKDGSREEYSRDKLLAGILKACEKRPISKKRIDKIVGSIENRLRKSNEVKSRKIGRLVMTRLKKVDEVAYIRFASVYRDFESAKQFEREIKTLKK